MSNLTEKLNALDKRSKLMLGLLAVIVLGAGAFFMLKGGGSSTASTASTPVTTPTGAVTVAPKATTTPAATLTPSPATTDNGTSTRDPFLPLAQEVGATTSASPTAGGATASATPSATDTASAAPAASASPSTAALSAGSHTVTLVSITGTKAVMQVDGAADSTDSAGAALGGGIALIKVTDDSVFVTYNSKAYAIAPGQTITV